MRNREASATGRGTEFIIAAPGSKPSRNAKSSSDAFLFPSHIVDYNFLAVGLHLTGKKYV